MRPLSYAQLYPQSHAARVADEAEKRSAERAARFNSDPISYLRTGQAIGRGLAVPVGADPAIAARALAEVAAMSAIVRPSYRVVPLAAPVVEPEMHEASGYHHHKMVDAITDAVRAMKMERGNRQRDQLKELLNCEFQRQGVGLKVIRWEAWA